MQILAYFIASLVLLGTIFYGANLSQTEGGTMVIGMVILGLGLVGSKNSDEVAPEDTPSLARQKND